MLSEYSALIVGAVLTFVVSICTMIITNYFSERQWRRQKHSEDRNTIIEQVYSPLYFVLDDLVYSYSTLAGYLSLIADRDTTEDDVKGFMRLVEPESKKIGSEALRALLKNKLGFIEPFGLREDLLEFLQLMEIFADNLLNIKDVGSWKDISSVKLRARKCQKVTHHFRIVIGVFRSFLDEEVFGKETPLSKIKYEPFLNNKRYMKIRSFLVEESEPVFQKQFDDYRREAEKDLGL